MAVDKPSKERRAFGRILTRQHAWVCSPGRPRIACVVTDISVGGARLEFSEERWLPYGFLLVIEPSNFSSWCEIRHQRGTIVGVEFMTAPDVKVRSESLSAEDVERWRGAPTGSPVRALLRAQRP